MIVSYFIVKVYNYRPMTNAAYEIEKLGCNDTFPPAEPEVITTLDPRIFNGDIMTLLEESNFEIKAVPSRDLFDKNSTSTSIMLDTRSKSYVFENEELNRAVIVKNDEHFVIPAINISFCFLDSYHQFEKSRNVNLWKPLFEETRVYTNDEENEKNIMNNWRFGQFLKHYLILLNQQGVEVYIDVIDDWRMKKYMHYLFSESSSAMFSNPKFFHIKQVGQPHSIDI